MNYSKMSSPLIFLLVSLLLPEGLLSQGSLANFPVNDCNIAKTCVGSPDSGCLQSGICQGLLKYSSDAAQPDKVRIEVFGVPPMPGAANFWIAMGVNHNSGSMSGTLVSECIYNNGGVSVFTSYNDGYVNQRLPAGQEKYGISGESGSFANGILTCSFLLDRVRTVQGQEFNLGSPLYVVLGDGPADGNTIKPHIVDPWTSADPYTLASAAQPQGVYPNLQSLNTVSSVPATLTSSPVQAQAPAMTSPGVQVPPMTSSRLTASLASASAALRANEAPSVISDCGTTKGCLAQPGGCLTTGNCQTVISYRNNPDRQGELLIELWRTATGQGDQYVAMGLNPTSPTMAGTGVVACVYTMANNNIDVLASFNPSYYSVPTDNAKEGITIRQVAADGAHLYCQFSLQTRRSFRGSFQLSPVNIDLNNPAYLILAYGPAKPNGQVGKHTVTPLIGNERVSFTKTSNAPQIEVQPPLMAMANDQGAASTQSAAPAAITECGTTKGCLAQPNGCLDRGNCQTVVSYRVNPNQQGELLLELWRNKAQGDQYVAAGFNPTAAKMAGAGVVACVDHTNTVQVLSSYNPSYFTVPVDNPMEGITVLQTASDASHLYCQFSLQTKKSFQGSFANAPVQLDLNNPTYLILAYGPAQPNGRLSKHTVTPLVVTAPVSLATVSVAASANSDMYKAHGGLMVGAWMFLASIGIFTARYYKKMWLSHKPCGLPLWFHIHRPIMLLTISCAIAAFVIIFVRVGQWTQTAPSVNPHPIIGIIAFILGLMQPIMAFFRPHPGTANRPIFNWAHFLVGFSAHIMAIAAIFLGLRMPQMTIDGASLWIMVAFSAFHALWLILLQLIEWIAPHVDGTRKTTMQMKTINSNGVVYEESVVQEPERSPASTLKTIMWFTHIIVVGGLTIAILVLIGISS